MNPDPRERLPREIFEELMEEGAEAFRNVLEKLLNLAMELERSEWERNHEIFVVTSLFQELLE